MKSTYTDRIRLTTPEGREVKLKLVGNDASAVAEIKENYISEGWKVVKHTTHRKFLPTWFWAYTAGCFVGGISQVLLASWRG